MIHDTVFMLIKNRAKMRKELLGERLGGILCDDPGQEKQFRWPL